jgi:hypothetical protein
MMPTRISAHIPYTLDRESAAYKNAYRRRTRLSRQATERINSQACALGIERPYLRNGQAIINRNTLIYTLINLRPQSAGPASSPNPQRRRLTASVTSQITGYAFSTFLRNQS